MLLNNRPFAATTGCSDFSRLILATVLCWLAGCGGSTNETPAAEQSSTTTNNSAVPEISLADASKAGNLKAVRQHIAAGSNIDTTDAGGSTPLNTACVFGQTEVAKVLIESGANLETKNNEQTGPLFNAAFFCRAETVELLLKHNANVNTTDKNGTPLVDIMAAPWEAVSEIYAFVFAAVGLKFDAAKIRAARPTILKLLKEHMAKGSTSKAMSTNYRSEAEVAQVRAKIPAIADADWSMYNHDVRGWRFNFAEEGLSANTVSKLAEKWRFPAPNSGQIVGAIHATPTVVNGHVYFGTATWPAFYKLKPNGSLGWVYRIDSGTTSVSMPKGGVNRIAVENGVMTSALVTTKAVFFGNSAGVFFALDRVTGAELWKVDTRSAGFPGHHAINIFNASAILADGKVIVGGGGYEHPYPLDSKYPCCTGQGFVVAFDPDSGDVAWKYDVGEKPKKLLEPIAIEDANGKHVFQHGPSTSSVWSTPSFDESTGTIFFGTDVHNSPRQPTEDDPRLYSKYSAAVIAVDVATGQEKWVTQINEGDIFNHAMSGYDPKTKRYKDCSIGDTPKLYSIDVAGQSTSVVGVGCKNGGFYVMRSSDGKLIAQTPVYSGEPKYPLSPKRDPRMIALPSAVGGIQTGCAMDGKNVFTNGIDWLSLNTKSPGFPEGGRVVSATGSLDTENWRHERPKIRSPSYTGGDPVGAGIALAADIACFAPTVSEKLIVLDAKSGEVAKELPIGTVWSGPSISRSRIYVGTGSVLFLKKQETGSLICFGLPGEDEVDRMGNGNE